MKKFESFFCFCFVLFISDKKNQPSALEQYNVIMRSLQGYELGCKLFSPSHKKNCCCRKIKVGDNLNLSALKVNTTSNAVRI